MWISLHGGVSDGSTCDVTRDEIIAGYVQFDDEMYRLTYWLVDNLVFCKGEIFNQPDA